MPYNALALSPKATATLIDFGTQYRTVPAVRMVFVEKIVKA